MLISFIDLSEQIIKNQIYPFLQVVSCVLVSGYIGNMLSTPWLTVQSSLRDHSLDTFNWSEIKGNSLVACQMLFRTIAQQISGLQKKTFWLVQGTWLEESLGTHLWRKQVSRRALWLSRITSSMLNKGSPVSEGVRQRWLEASMGEQVLMKTLGHREEAYRRWKQSCGTWKGCPATLYIQG